MAKQRIVTSKDDIELAFKVWFEKYKSNPDLFEESNDVGDYASTCAAYFLELLRFSNEF